ncbi:hypothetical protein LAZ67_22000055 [Cordylochernes scorpioides]|uniref:Integrase p58-like C-terminal domain-containing protein n=1 Tax=Cordylochernes scorpioides TaxID=51811 RepID=A0ABY6LN02_9ARAC|nr:hypothetical protein LAZ67_22000054 [Cordylochernes scorpioides]UYV82589.1 hypothetical protein LAZ67_22000055 [Cordylochernes scorpioides]
MLLRDRDVVLGQLDHISKEDCFRLLGFVSKIRYGSLKKQSSFDQISDFDRGRIVNYRDCEIFFREIGSRVGRNRTTVIRICDRWMQEGTTDRRVRSHPPQCTTSRDDRQIVRMAVTDHSVTSRTVAQHIQSVTHHPVSARTIRRRLQQNDVSTADGAMKEGCGRQNGIVFTDESRFCLQHHDGRIRVWRHRGDRMLNSCVMHSHTGPAPGIMVWGGIGYHSRTPLVRIAGHNIEAMQQRNRREDVGKPREKVCRGSLREVWIDKCQSKGWQTGEGVQLASPWGRDQPSPAGAAVEGSWPACRGFVCAEKTWQSGERSLSEKWAPNVWPYGLTGKAWVNNGRIQHQYGSSRPRDTEEREDREIVITDVAAPDSTLSIIRRVTGTRVSKMTINRRLRERNLRARRRPPYSRSFDKGDLVMLAVPKKEGYTNLYGPFRVEARVSDVNFRVRGVTMNDVKVVHVDRMKAFRNRR